MAKSNYEGTRYEGTYNFGGVEVPLVVNFTASAVRQYDGPGNTKEQVVVTDFSFTRGDYGQPMRILPLVKGDKVSEQLLWQTLGPQNPAVSTYGDGQHATPERVQKKIDLWGPREGVQRCYMLESGEGYFNTGSSCISIKQGRIANTPGIKTEMPLESGLLQSAGGNVENLAALVVAVNCLMHSLYSRAPDFFDSEKGTYTVSPESRDTIACLEAGGFANAWGSAFLYQVVQSSNGRLKAEDETVQERSGDTYVPKEYLVCDYSHLPGSMVEMEIAGASAEFDDAA